MDGCREVLRGIKANFSFSFTSHLLKTFFLKWIQFTNGNSICKKKQKSTPSHTDKDMHKCNLQWCVEYTQEYLHNQQAALQSPLTTACASVQGEIMPQHTQRKHNSLSTVIGGSQISSQHVHDPKMIIRCSGLRRVANNELSVRNRQTRQESRQVKPACR